MDTKQQHARASSDNAGAIGWEEAAGELPDNALWRKEESIKGAVPAPPSQPARLPKPSESSNSSNSVAPKNSQDKTDGLPTGFSPTSSEHTPRSTAPEQKPHSTTEVWQPNHWIQSAAASTVRKPAPGELPEPQAVSATVLSDGSDEVGHDDVGAEGTSLSPAKTSDSGAGQGDQDWARNLPPHLLAFHREIEELKGPEHAETRSRLGMKLLRRYLDYVDRRTQLEFMIKAYEFEPLVLETLHKLLSECPPTPTPAARFKPGGDLSTVASTVESFIFGIARTLCEGREKGAFNLLQCDQGLCDWLLKGWKGRLPPPVVAAFSESSPEEITDDAAGLLVALYHMSVHARSHPCLRIQGDDYCLSAALFAWREWGSDLLIFLLNTFYYAIDHPPTLLHSKCTPLGNDPSVSASFHGQLWDAKLTGELQQLLWILRALSLKQSAARAS
ncbi:hypothetical protein KFL_004630040 [Klebsormidium nitens]|uniref:Uncharacterized protein n=1 Tax=Klebsormidium nitens TaxID=105231 RepID=A0A1Y1IJN8_KLENI|nr:hypothetical protein KFL_004630040 [Klebsormidium nitens]|eukprot:GAQ88837.1 hypothetical protein KFL_004630040 [Klebsormidium nitens]